MSSLHRLSVSVSASSAVVEQHADMKSSSLLGALACAAVAAAQSSPSAPFDVGNYLPAVWNGSVVNEPGMLFAPDQVVVGPSLGAAQTNASTSQPFVAIMIDPDVVLNASTGVKSEFLHVLQPNLYALNGTHGNLTFNANGPNASTVVGAAYMSPGPPPGSTHNYNIFLFEQPANFTMPPGFASYNMPKDELARILFNITLFANESGLGQPVAANYFRVLNGTEAQSSAVATQTATSGVAFPSGYSFSSVSSVSTTTTTGVSMSTTTVTTSGSVSSGSTSPTPTSSTTSSSAAESYDLGQSFVKAVCLAVAASLPWIW